MLESIHKQESAPQIASDTVVLDIETTGLHRSNDSVFLVGIQTQNEFRQWLATSRKEESSLLETIRPFLANKTLITYNGDHFDLPFLSARFTAQGMSFPSVLSEDWFAYLRPRRAFFRFPHLRLRTLALSAGLVRHDPYTGAQIAAFSSHLEEEDAKQAVLLHNEEDVRELSQLLPFFHGLQQQLQLQSPLRAELISLEIKGDRATMRYHTQDVARPERQEENSFGALGWVENDLYCTVPIHRLPEDELPSVAPAMSGAGCAPRAHQAGPHARSRASDGVRIAAVSPSYARDAATPSLPPPFLTLSSSAGYFSENCHQLVRDLFTLH